jgi:hypothetical protein
MGTKWGTLSPYVSEAYSVIQNHANLMYDD